MATALGQEGRPSAPQELPISAVTFLTHQRPGVWRRLGWRRGGDVPWRKEGGETAGNVLQAGAPPPRPPASCLICLLAGRSSDSANAPRANKPMNVYAS